MSASIRPFRGQQVAVAGLTLEIMNEVIEQMMDFSLWCQVNRDKDLDREGLRQAAAQLLQLKGAIVSHHVIDHLVTAAVVMGQYEVLRDQQQWQPADEQLAELGFTACELERHWH